MHKKTVIYILAIGGFIFGSFIIARAVNDTVLEKNQRISLATDKLWTYDTGHASDLIRLRWLTNTAKPAITWYDDSNMAVAALVSHDYLSYPDNRHQHISLETKNRTDNSLHSRFECKWGFDDGNDGGFCGVASSYDLRVGSGSDMVMIDGDFRQGGEFDLFPNAHLGNTAIGLRVGTTTAGALAFTVLGSAVLQINDDVSLPDHTLSAKKIEVDDDCFGMKKDGVSYKIEINPAGNGLLVSQGTC